jgi:hypothetical protein
MKRFVSGQIMMAGVYIKVTELGMVTHISVSVATQEAEIGRINGGGPALAKKFLGRINGGGPALAKKFLRPDLNKTESSKTGRRNKKNTN